MANWSEPEQRSGKSAGQTLAENVRRCIEVIHKVNPDARLAIWSDMFDPHHNAVKDYYLVSGDLAGSWEGLPKEILVVNWNHDQAAKSLGFFAQRHEPFGHSAPGVEKGFRSTVFALERDLPHLIVGLVDLAHHPAHLQSEVD